MMWGEGACGGLLWLVGSDGICVGRAGAGQGRGVGRGLGFIAGWCEKGVLKGFGPAF